MAIAKIPTRRQGARRTHNAGISRHFSSLRAVIEAGTHVATSSSVPISSIQGTRAANATQRAASRPSPPAKEVRARRTPTSPAQFRQAIAKAHRQVTGQTPNKGMLDILTAHVAHETGNGDRMFNYNFGGIKGPSERGYVAKYGTTEFFDGKKTSIRSGFRAYGSLHEGAVDYVRFMRARYGSAVREAERGDVDGFSAALKRRKYYTAPEEAYAAAMRAHVRQGFDHHPSGVQGAERFQVRKGAGFLYGADLAREAASLDGSTAPLPTAVEVARVIDSVSASSARIAAPIETEDDSQGFG